MMIITEAEVQYIHILLIKSRYFAPNTFTEKAIAITAQKHRTVCHALATKSSLKIEMELKINCAPCPQISAFWTFIPRGDSTYRKVDGQSYSPIAHQRQPPRDPGNNRSVFPGAKHSRPVTMFQSVSLDFPKDLGVSRGISALTNVDVDIFWMQKIFGCTYYTPPAVGYTLHISASEAAMASDIHDTKIQPYNTVTDWPSVSE